ncbi:MAG: SDR family oxidoreductase [bacterium]|nr:SDR family oxidoreductase [bacterium]
MDRIVLVTGAGRGIGLEMCRLLLDEGDTVVACPRRPDSRDLALLAKNNVGRLHLVPMDVGDDASVSAAADEIATHVRRIDALFNNAGVYPKDSGGVESLDHTDLMRAFDINTLGPLRVVGRLLPLLKRGSEKRLIQITSLMGSIADNTSGGSYAYRMSKTALNMAVRNLAHELGPAGFICLTVHPGWVQTRMGGSHAPLDMTEATREILRIGFETTAADNGSFKGPGGKTLPF